MEKILQVIRDILALLLGQRVGGGHAGAAAQSSEGVAPRSEGLVFDGEMGEGHSLTPSDANARESEETKDFWSGFAKGSAQETAVIASAENHACPSVYASMEWGGQAVSRTHQNTPSLER